MVTEKVLTDEEIIMIGQQDRLIEAGENGHILPVTFARAIEQAILKSPEIQSLKRMAETLDEKIETYERFGEICEFEGEPMIHAAHLEELRDAMEQQA